MIPKVVPNRRDGKSSFKQLAAYVTEGITQSGEPPEKYSWSNLTQYITKQSVLDALGDEVEKTIGVEIGNVSSLANAPAEMYAVAQQNPRTKDPVYHFILSWPEHERPQTQDIFAAARHTLSALGMSEHQYIIAIHANTDNLHAHIEVNRIHPKTYRPFDTYRDFLTLHRAAREAEIMFGWHHDNGAFKVVEVDGVKHVVRNDDYEDPEITTTRPGARRAEIWTGEQSLEAWCKGEPAADLKRVLADPDTSSWQDVHRALEKFGLELRDSGGGGMKVVDVSEASDVKVGKPLAVSASAAFRFLKRKALEERLGAFEARSPEHSHEPVKTYKRDPHKRLEARLARKVVRDALHEKYKAARAAAETRKREAEPLLRPFIEQDKARHAALRASYAQSRERIRKDGAMTPSQKQQAYMLARMTMLRVRKQLSEQIRKEHAQRRTLVPSVPSWRAWVEQQAQLGDEGAISALRGMIYQDGRDLQKKEARDSARKDENAILPASPVDLDPTVRALSGMTWQVAKNGKVSYKLGTGELAFHDEGERITYGRRSVSDEALQQSLLYGADKWKDGICISGGDFAFKARMVRAAVENGIEVNNIELRGLVQQVRDELAARSSLSPDSIQSTPRAPLISAAGDDIEALVRSADGRAKFSTAGVSGKSYAGGIVAQNARHIAQQVAEHRYVLHDRRQFDRPPEIGDNVTVRYSGGKAVATQRKGRPERSGR